MRPYHFKNDIVRITIWHKPGKRASACHAVPAAVVDDDQITTALLDELRAEADTSPCANNQLAIFNCPTKISKNLFSVAWWCHLVEQCINDVAPIMADIEVHLDDVNSRDDAGHCTT